MKHVLPLLVVLGLAACAEPTNPVSVSRGGPMARLSLVRSIDAMTRNMYVGGDVFPVLAALQTPDPADDLPALLAAIAEQQETAFPARVQALADEIALARPHVLGLQEVSVVDVQLPAFLVPPAGVSLQYDFLAMLLDALADRGLQYEVASAASFYAFRLDPAPGVVISSIDRDVLLIDASRVAIVPGSAFGRTFANNVGDVGGGLSLNRGYVGAKVIIEGTELMVVNTHLEALVGPAFSLLRAAQASEIVAAIGEASPALVIGDLNENPGTPMHSVFSLAGFRDVWADMRPGVDGYTCCHVPNLANQVAHGVFSERIDYVFARGLAHGNGTILGSVALHGTSPGDRVQGMTHLVWPSDHAGVSARLFLPPGAP